jgi:type II secretory pathway pseudopilin PulG
MTQSGTPPPHSTHGLTLVEILVALAITVVLMGLIALALPRLAGSAAAQTNTARTVQTVTTLTRAITTDFKQDAFAGFLQGNATSMQAVFTQGSGRTLKLTEDMLTGKTILAPNLGVEPGGYVLLIAGNGQAKVVKATAVNGEAVTVSCPPGLPSNVAITAYRARLLSLNVQGAKLTRTDGDRVQVMSDAATGLQFSYAYVSPTGRFLLNPPGAPASRLPEGTLTGFVPQMKDLSTRIDASDIVPAEPSRVESFIPCETLAVPIENGSKLTVGIEGLPSGTTPDVTVNGPDASVDGDRPTSTRAYLKVVRGTYSITVRDVIVNGIRYRGEARNSPTRLIAPWGQIMMLARYTQVSGNLNINVSGLGVGMTSNLVLAGPYGETFTTGNALLEIKTLPVGTYTLTPSTVNGTDGTYSAPGLTFMVLEGQTTTINAAFTRTPTLGGMTLNVSGLPTGVQTTLTYRGPINGTTIGQNGQTTLSNLIPGTYYLTSTSAIVGSATYTTPALTITVVPGISTPVNVVYAGSGGTPPANPSASGIGNIEVIITGIGEPRNQIANLFGPRDEVLRVTDSIVTFSNFPVGTYTLRLPSLVLNSGVTVTPDPSGVSMTVVAGQTTRARFTYTRPRGTTPPSGTPPTGGLPPERPEPPEHCDDGALRCIDGDRLSADIQIGGQRYGADTSLDSVISTPRGSMTLEQYLENYNPEYGNVDQALRSTSWGVNPNADSCTARGCDVPEIPESGSGPRDPSEPITPPEGTPPEGPPLPPGWGEGPSEPTPPIETPEPPPPPPPPPCRTNCIEE